MIYINHQNIMLKYDMREHFRYSCFCRPAQAHARPGSSSGGRSWARGLPPLLLAPPASPNPHIPAPPARNAMGGGGLPWPTLAGQGGASPRREGALGAPPPSHEPIPALNRSSGRPEHRAPRRLPATAPATAARACSGRPGHENNTASSTHTLYDT